jgi:hypothetical protein
LQKGHCQQTEYAAKQKAFYVFHVEIQLQLVISDKKD